MRVSVAFSVLLILTTASLPSSRAQESALVPWHALKAIHAGMSPSMLSFSPDGRSLACAARTQWWDRADGRVKVGDNNLVLIDRSDTRRRCRLGRHGEILVSIGWLPSGRLAVVYDGSNGSQSCVEYGLPHDGRPASRAEELQWRRSQTKTLFDPRVRALGEAGAMDARVHGGDYGTFSDDGTLFASHYGYEDGAIIPPWHFVGRTVVWQTADWAPRASWTRNPGADNAQLFFSADDEVLADSPWQSGPRSDDVRYVTTEPVTRMTAPFFLLSPQPHEGKTVHYWGPQPAQAMSPDGEWLVASVMNQTAGSLLRIDVERGTVLVPNVAVIDPNPRMRSDRYYSALAVSRDGRWLASGQVDGTIKMWDISTWMPVQEVPSLHHEVQSLTFSPDSRTLAAGLDDKTIRMWRL